MKPERPISVFCIGLLFTVFGVWALYEVVTELTVGNLSLNLAVFWVFTGPGLLSGKESSRQWARFWLALLQVVMLVAAVVIVFVPSMVYFHLFNLSLHGGAAVLPGMVLIAFLFWLFRNAKAALERPAAICFFQPESEETPK